MLPSSSLSVAVVMSADRRDKQDKQADWQRMQPMLRLPLLMTVLIAVAHVGASTSHLTDQKASERESIKTNCGLISGGKVKVRERVKTRVHTSQ